MQAVYLEDPHMKSILVIITWLSAAPIVATTELSNAPTCRAAMAAAAEMIRAQALSNLTGPHRELQTQPGPSSDELVLRTPTVGREVARLRCVTSAALVLERPAR